MQSAICKDAAEKRGLSKRLTFASAEVTVTLFFATVNSWYLFYLVNVAELNALLAGGAFFLGRFIDAIFDPVIGRISDNIAPVNGRKYLSRIALIPTSLVFISMWLLPGTFESQAGKMIAATFCFGLFATGYTLLSVPRLAMLPDFEPSYHGRTWQISFDMVFVFLGVLIVTAGVPAMITALSGQEKLGDTDVSTWLVIVAMLSLCAAAFYLPFLAYVPDASTEFEEGKRPPVADALRLATSLPSFMTTNVVFFLCAFALISLQSILPFFLERHVGLSGNEHTIILGLVFFTAILFFPVWGIVGSKVGKENGLILGAAIFCIFLILAIFIEEDSGLSPLILSASFFTGAGLAALSVFPWAMVPDAIQDFCCLAPGSEGIGTSVFTFNNKLAAGLAVGVNSIYLSLSQAPVNEVILENTGFDIVVFATTIGPLFFVILAIGFSLRLRRISSRLANKN